MSKILKFDHVQITPRPEQFEQLVGFYTKILGFTVQRRWIGRWSGAERDCAMLEAPNGVRLEIFANPNPVEMIGAIRHISLDVDDVDGMLAECKAAGMKIVNPMGKEIEDEKSYVIVMDEENYYAMRLSFVLGPAGEIIEFQQELFDPKQEL